MPLYEYSCNICEKKALKKLKRDLTSEEYDELVLFETVHSMNPSDEELKESTICPRCNKIDCTKSLKNSKARGYILGNGYLDKAGVKRDMHLYHLTNDDPYAKYRVPGEVDEMKSRLKKAGKHDPKTKHFTAKSNKK